MEYPFVPENVNLASLFERVYGREIHTKHRPQEIYDFLLEPIMAVWFDENAKNEILCKNWNPYKVIRQHMIDRKKTFSQMDLYQSMCFDLFWYIYH